MKHETISASPGELAYSIDDPPRPVSTSENSSMGDVYLSAVLEYPAWCVHRLRCPHLSDHPTQEAKPTSYDPIDELCTFSAAVGDEMRRLTSLPSHGGEGQGEGVLSFHTRHSSLGSDFLLSNVHESPDFLRGFEFFYFRFKDCFREPNVNLQPSALAFRRSFAMSLRRRSADTLLEHKLARKWHVGIFKNPSKTRKLARKTHSFFFRGAKC